MTVVFKKYKLFLLSLVFLSSCYIFNPKDEELTISKKNYNGTELRIDGYYYWIESNFSEYFTNVYFLYNNGIFYNYGGVESDNPIGVQKFLKNNLFTISRGKNHWGLFNVTDSNLVYEHWVSNTENYVTAKFRAKIINDTTILVYQLEDSKGVVTPLQRTLKFQPFTPKPDSTNEYIP